MKNYKVGLDFGTSTSKACLFDSDKNEYTFLEIDGDYFYPSIIGLDDSGKIHFGNNARNYNDIFQYFKMASLIDEDFIFITNKKNARPELYSGSNFDKFNQNKNYSPEFLSSVYLAELFFKIEKVVVNSTKKKELKGLLGRLTRSVTEKISINYTVGFPTEFNTNTHLKRKFKMQSILVIAFELKKKFQENESLEDVSIDVLVKEANSIYDDLKLNEERLIELLMKNGLSLYPEAAASLTFIRENRGIVPPGYYMTMDIGAGTTDISYIYITDKYNFHYLASDSIGIASNDIHSIVAKSNNLSEIRLLSEFLDTDNEDYRNAEYVINKDLGRNAKFIFARRVGKILTDMREKFNHQPCLLYGGGSNFNIFKSGEYLIFDNGSPNTINDNLLTYVLKEPLVDVNNFTVNVKNLKKINSEKLSRLITCFGLASVTPKLGDFTTSNERNILNDDLPEWLFVEDYMDSAAVKYVYKDVSHPTNEDMYIKEKIFHVVDRKWVS